MRRFMLAFSIILLISILVAEATTSIGDDTKLLNGNASMESSSLTQALGTAGIPPDGLATSCTDLGLVKNDVGAGPHNMALLLEAVRDGKKILVDGVYNIRSASHVPLSDVFVSLTGTTSDAEFKLDGNGATFLDIADNVDVDISNVKFTQGGQSVQYFMVFAPDCLSNKVVIEGNTFTGNIQFVRFRGSNTIDPSATPFGILEFYFANNKVNDVKTVFLNLIDMPSDKIVIEYNTINNFDYTFLDNGITNDIAYTDEMYAGHKLMIVKNNIVTCDDDWWGDSANTAYYCLALFEGVDCVYEGNHIEGLKFSSLSGGGAALYDSYLSCTNLQYNNNVLKNNLNYNLGKPNATLLKSKEGPTIGSVARHYENNTYIIEESFITMCSNQLAVKYSEEPAVRLAASLAASWVQFADLQTDSSTYEILNNTFDIYDLRMGYLDGYIERMDIEGNIFKCKKISGQLSYSAMVSVNGGIGYSDKTCIIKNNKIKAEGLGPGFFYLVRGKYGTILIENNTLAIPFSYFLYKTEADKAVIAGNTVQSVYYQGASSDSKIKNLIKKDNTYI